LQDNDARIEEFVKFLDFIQNNQDDKQDTKSISYLPIDVKNDKLSSKSYKNMEK